MTDLTDFSPATGHHKWCNCTLIGSGAPCSGTPEGDDCASALYAMLPEIDRNARAHGWECGHSGELLAGPGFTSEDNPFIDPNWRDRL
jgi:hypothetical protein